MFLPLPPPSLNSVKIYILKIKIKLSLLKKVIVHLPPSKALLIKLLVLESGEGDRTTASPLLGPFQKNVRDTSKEWGPRVAFCSHIKLILIFCPLLLGTSLLWQGVGRDERGQHLNGKGRDGKGCQFNSRKPTAPGRIRQTNRLGLCGWD